jgi:molybdopterin converting factor subunit 1
MRALASEPKVRLLLFAGARDVVGASEVELPLDAPCTAAELWPRLLDAHPGLAPWRASIRLAINGSYAGPADAVSPGDEVALIPPVAGG